MADNSLPTEQLTELLLQLKTLVTAAPNQARTIINSHPQLPYTLIKMMAILNLIDMDVVQKTIALSVPQAVAPPPVSVSTSQYSYATPPHVYSSTVPQPMTYPQPSQYPNQPPQTSNSNATAAALAGLSGEQRDMILKILALTPEQLNQLPPTERSTFLAIKRQFLGPGA